MDGRILGGADGIGGQLEGGPRYPAKSEILVDLKSATCIDRAGRYLLELMYGNGVKFLRAGLAIQDTLDQIMEQQECKH